MRRLQLLVPIAVFVATACSGDSRPSGAAPVGRDSAGIRIVESSVPLAPGGNGGSAVEIDSVPSVVIGIEEGEEAYQLDRIFDSHRMPDGRIVIGNSGSLEVRVYDAAGKHLKNVGRKGAGPNEYGELTSLRMHPAGDSLVVDDNGAFRVNVLGPDLEFVETRRFTLTGAVGRPFLQGIFADGSWLVMSFDNNGRIDGAPETVLESRFSLLRYAADGTPGDSIATFAGRKRYVNKVGEVIHHPFIPLTADPLHAISGNEVVVLRGDKAELEYLDQQGKLLRLVRWPRERVPTATAWPVFKEKAIAGLASDNERNRTMYTAFYNKDVPLPEFAPLYGAMKVDAEQRVWLERFRMPGETVRTWDVIARDGAWVGTVTTPPRSNVHRIGKDFLLVRSLDSLGVERVQVHPLRWREMP